MPFLTINDQDHRCIRTRITASLGFGSAEGACGRIRGYEEVHAIRSHIRSVAMGDPVAAPVHPK